MTNTMISYKMAASAIPAAAETVAKLGESNLSFITGAQNSLPKSLENASLITNKQLGSLNGDIIGGSNCPRV